MSVSTRSINKILHAIFFFLDTVIYVFYSLRLLTDIERERERRTDREIQNTDKSLDEHELFLIISRDWLSDEFGQFEQRFSILH